MYYYRARKQLLLAVYPDFDHLHYTGNTCYVGYERKLTDPEIEQRDFVELGKMKHKTFMETYGSLPLVPHHYNK